MAANPLYYTKRHSTQIQAACPQMTQEHDLQDRYGVDYSPLFIRGRYDGPLYTWKRLCDLYVKTDDPAEYINLNDDENMRLAADVLARKLSDGDVLNRIGKRAIELNLEVASRYAGEEDLKELGLES